MLFRSRARSPGFLSVPPVVKPGLGGLWGSRGPDGTPDTRGSMGIVQRVVNMPRTGSGGIGAGLQAAEPWAPLTAPAEEATADCRLLCAPRGVSGGLSRALKPVIPGPDHRQRPWRPQAGKAHGMEAPWQQDLGDAGPQPPRQPAAPAWVSSS